MLAGYRSGRILSRRKLLALNGAWSRIGERQGSDRAFEDYCLRISRSAMACRFEIVVRPEGKNLLTEVQECLDEVDRLESILSIFRSESEVSLLNRTPVMQPVQVGSELFELLRLCEQLYRETEGAFDVTTGSLSQCWGFEQRDPRFPVRESLLAAQERVGFSRISLYEDRTVTLCASDLRINFGGVGKGYALDRAAKKLRGQEIRNALLSAGGSSVLALGSGLDCSGWLVGLRHPIFKDQRMGTLSLRSCAMGTSGQEEQWFASNGQRYGHIVDPRTGSPARGVLSVSVIAESAALADALATAFFVGGPELAERYCGKHKDVLVVMLLEQSPAHSIVIGSSSHATVEI